MYSMYKHLICAGYDNNVLIGMRWNCSFRPRIQIKSYQDTVNRKWDLLSSVWDSQSNHSHAWWYRMITCWYFTSFITCKVINTIQPNITITLYHAFSGWISVLRTSYQNELFYNTRWSATIIVQLMKYKNWMTSRVEYDPLTLRWEW